MEPFPVKTIQSIWRMQRLVNHISRPFDGRKGKEFKLTLAQFRVMRAIAVYPGTSAQAICQFDAVNSMLVSRSVRDLAQRGWVSRTTDKADGRRLKLTLTVEGRNVFEQMFPNMEALYQDVLSPLDEQEHVIFDEALQKMLTHVHREHFDDDSEIMGWASSSHPNSNQTLIDENETLREMLIALQMENHVLKKKLNAQS